MKNLKQNFSIKQKIDERLLQIANFLLLNTSFIDNLGLLNGKMGVAIFFYQYSRYTNNKIFENYASELIDEIYDEISTNSPVDFADGLTGIGWGIEYLIHEKYVNADRDEVLEEIDNMAYKNMCFKPDLHENGNNLFGFGIYYLVRLSQRGKDDKIPTTISDKINLELVIGKYVRLLVYNRYLCPYNQCLSVRALGSILYFLDEAIQFKSYQPIIEKILTYLQEYIEFSLLEKVGLLDRFTLAKILEKIAGHVLLPSLKKIYKDVVENVKVFDDNDNEESIINQLSRLSWYSLVFGIDIIDSEQFAIFFHKAFDIVDNETTWNKRLNMSYKNNMGLDNGLAGLGFVLTLYAMYCGK